MKGGELSQVLLCLQGGNMAFFETENAMLNLMNERVALLEVKRGRKIDLKQAKQCLDLLERFVSKGYSIVIDRNTTDASQYKIFYEAIEDRRLLRKIAVVWSNLDRDYMEYGPDACKKKLSVFQHFDEALSWAAVIKCNGQGLAEP